MSKQTDKRRHILSESEISELYSLPRLNNIQREQSFSLADGELKAVNQQSSLSSKVYFILLLGYFKEKPLISQFHFRDIKDDLKYVLIRYFPGHTRPKNPPSRSQIYYLRKKLLDMLHYRNLDGNIKPHLDTYLADVATICAEPRYLFDESMAFFARERIALPRYTVVQDLVSRVLTAESQRIETILAGCLQKKTKQRLVDLLSSSDSITRLGKLKKPAKDFSFSEINREIESHRALIDIYSQAKEAITKLDLSPRNLEYYSGLVHYYSVTKLRRFSQKKVFLYSLCYIYFRYQKINDNLIAAFGYWTRKHTESARNHGKNCAMADADLLMENLKSTLLLLHMYVDNSIGDDTSFGTVRRKGFERVSKIIVSDLCEDIEHSSLDKTEYQWTYCDKNISKIRNNLRDAFLCLDLDFSDTDHAYTKQVELAGSELTSFREIQSVDKRTIPSKLKPYLIKDDVADKKRYEWHIYQRVNNSIGKGEIYVTESEKHKRWEEDLISEKDWKNSGKWINKAGLVKLFQPISDTLGELESQLKMRIDMACDGIAQGNNRFVVLEDKAGELKWSFPVKKSKESINNPFFDQLSLTSIIRVLEYVDRRCQFTEVFEHIDKDKEKKTVSKTDLLACIFANGTNYGLGNMAIISDRSFATLRHTENSYVTLENVHKSNDRVANAISDLPIFQYYNIEEEQLYASIDGQKYETRINTFKARYSSKYFKDKGVSAMTLSCNHVALNTTVIGANEYEGHYAFDLLYNNTTDIQPDILSSDTHGTNQVNFALLDLFGYTFAPRYAKFKRVFYDMFTIDGNVKSGEPFIKLKKAINYGSVANFSSVVKNNKAVFDLRS